MTVAPRLPGWSESSLVSRGCLPPLPNAYRRPATRTRHDWQFSSALAAQALSYGTVEFCRPLCRRAPDPRNPAVMFHVEHAYVGSASPNEPPKVWERRSEFKPGRWALAAFHSHRQPSVAPPVPDVLVRTFRRGEERCRRSRPPVATDHAVGCSRLGERSRLVPAFSPRGRHASVRPVSRVPRGTFIRLPGSCRPGNPRQCSTWNPRLLSSSPPLECPRHEPR